MRTVQIRRDRTELRTVLVPGLHGSSHLNWLGLWQEEHPDYERVVPSDWSAANLQRFAAAIVAKVREHSGPAVLVAHGFGALAAVHAASDLSQRVRGALLVAPSDPVHLGLEPLLREVRLGKGWSVVASRNDPAMLFERARAWSGLWSSGFLDAGFAGRIDAESGFGEWPQGVRWLLHLQRSAARVDLAIEATEERVSLAA